MDMALNSEERQFATDVLNASISIMSILVAVIALLGVEYAKVRSDPIIKAPYFATVWTTTGIAAFAGLLGLAALLRRTLEWLNTPLLGWAFALLIMALTIDIYFVASALTR